MWDAAQPIKFDDRNYKLGKSVVLSSRTKICSS